MVYATLSKFYIFTLHSALRVYKFAVKLQMFAVMCAGAVRPDGKRRASIAFNMPRARV